MNPHIDILGVGADGPASLRPEQIRRIEAADFLAGGERHLNFFLGAQGERFVLKDDMAALRTELEQRFPTQRCVVLASGDPLFFGIGSYLVGALGSDKVRVEPALSSMQLAFARAGIAWQGAALASIHGRDLRATLLPLLGRTPIGLFTQDGDSPAAVARFFLQYGLNNYQAVVGENLGAADEQVSRWASLQELADKHFAPLNYLVLRRLQHPSDTEEVGFNRTLIPGAPDEVFAGPEEGPVVMTRQEVRAIAVAKLFGPSDPGDTVWDIGAGLGSVSVEIAVLRPHLEVIAVERDPTRVAFLQQNRERFGAYNIRVIHGTAPEALAREAQKPRLVFLGGSGERLPAILEFVAHRLDNGGRLLANFVTLEHLSLMLQMLHEWSWPFEVTEIHVSRSDRLAGLTGLKPQRGVFLVAAYKQGSGA